MKRYLFCLGLLFLVLGCAESEDNTEVVVLSVDMTSSTELPDTAVFESVDEIFLQTTPESLIYDVHKVILGDDIMVVADKWNRKVLLFDYDGRFIGPVGAVGRGPGEYIQFTDVALDERSRRIVLYADMNEALMYYDLQGRFIESREHKNLVRSIDFHDGSLFAVNAYIEDRNAPYVERIDADGTASRIFEHSDNQRLNMYVLGRTLSNSADNILFTQRYDNNIYEVKDGKVRPKYHIDFGAADVQNVLSEPSDEQLEQELRSGDYVYGIVNITENDDYLFFSTNRSGFVMYDKRSGKADKIRFLNSEGNRYSVSKLLASSNDKNRVVFLLRNQSLMNMQRVDKSRGESLRTAEFAARLAQVREDDNPAIVVCTLK